MNVPSPQVCETYLSKEHLPRHIAIIPDGNRRWAQSNALSCLMGHRYGADKLIEIVNSAKEAGVGAVTFYGFSTENWQRPKKEVKAVFSTIEKYCQQQQQNMVEHGIRLHTIGNVAQLPASLQDSLSLAKEKTAKCDKIDLVLALNYGCRDELRRAFYKLISKCQQGTLVPEQIDEQTIDRHLDTYGLPEVDLLIRPGGERRISNFLLWQLSYAELYFSDILWPEFSCKDLQNAIVWYQQRQRRRGK